MLKTKAMNTFLAIGFFLAVNAVAGDVNKSEDGKYVITRFGNVDKAETFKETLDKACKWIESQGGGVLVIPPEISPRFNIENTYQTERKKGPAVTISDLREGYEKNIYPSIGFRKPEGGYVSASDSRIINMPSDVSMPPFGTNQIKGIRNAVVRGVGSYGQFTLNAVKPGKNQKIYLPTIQGIFKNLKINLSGTAGSWTGKGFETVTIKDMGWEKLDGEIRYYVVADLKKAHPKKAILGTKHVTGSLVVDATSNCDNQTAGELIVNRKHYANGDSWVINGSMIYQGNIISALGDERAGVFSASVSNDLNPFHGKVQSMDWSDNALKIEPGLVNINKIATSRPLINMNKKKWVTKGKVMIVPPDNLGGFILKDPSVIPEKAIRNGIVLKDFSYTVKDTGKPSVVNYDDQPVKKFKYIYKGKAYPSIITNGIDFLGGRIIGDKDCGWTEDVVGRYFAISDPGECIMPGEKTIGKTRGGQYRARRPVYRWYLIKEFTKNPDGSCDIKIERNRWSVINAGSPHLYNEDNYTWDGHDRPMSYIIAPGANVYDIGDAWKNRRSGALRKGEENTVRISPSPCRGTEFDFAPGDTIEQAIGPDPVHPQLFYSAFSNNLPSIIEQPAIYLCNVGKVSMGAAMTVNSRGRNNREDIKQRKDRKAPWTTVLNIGAVSGNGILFNADVTDAAINFKQPNGHSQPVKWKHAKGETTLTVDPVTAEMEIKGSPVKVEGLAGTDSSNLRGINIPVKEGTKKLIVTFKKPETDAVYSVVVQPNWFSRDRIARKTANGFIVEFSDAAPADAKIDWILIK